MKNERQLLDAARKIDREALLTIYDHFAPKIYARAFQACQDPVQADQIVGKVFERFLHEVANGKGPDRDLKTYMDQSVDRLLADTL